PPSPPLFPYTTPFRSPRPPLRIPLRLAAGAQLAHVLPEQLQGLGAPRGLEQVLPHVLEVTRPALLVVVPFGQADREQCQRRSRRSEEHTSELQSRVDL